ncbi:MAG: transporter [Nitrospiraceae bacterium]|nr:transporter [Nitrospiraceae bacterium]
MKRRITFLRFFAFSFSISLLLVLHFFSSDALGAGLCCQLAGGVEENINGAYAPGAHDLTAALEWSFSDMDRLMEGAHKTTPSDVAAQGIYKTIPTHMEMTRYTLTLAYGVTPKLKVVASVPYVRNTMDMDMVMMDGMGMPMLQGMSMEPVSGLGDVTLMTLYRLWTNRRIRPGDALTLGIGVKTPTGSYTEKTSSGRFVHAHMQPGTGSWDPLVSLAYTTLKNPWLLGADFTYEVATRNSEGYKFGDTLTADLSAKYGLLPFMNLSGQLTYLHCGHATDDMGRYTNLTSVFDDPANTGEDSLWVAPGLEFVPVYNAGLTFRAQLPLWQRVNGIQLVSTSRLVTAVYYVF